MVYLTIGLQTKFNLQRLVSLSQVNLQITLRRTKLFTSKDTCSPDRLNS